MAGRSPHDFQELAADRAVGPQGRRPAHRPAHRQLRSPWCGRPAGQSCSRDGCTTIACLAIRYQPAGQRPVLARPLVGRRRTDHGPMVRGGAPACGSREIFNRSFQLGRARNAVAEELKDPTDRFQRLCALFLGGILRQSEGVDRTSGRWAGTADIPRPRRRQVRHAGARRREAERRALDRTPQRREANLVRNSSAILHKSLAFGGPARSSRWTTRAESRV